MFVWKNPLPVSYTHLDIHGQVTVAFQQVGDGEGEEYKGQQQDRIAVSYTHLMEQSDIEKVMEDNRNELNLQLPAYSQITKVKIHFEEFEKTGKKSIKRFMYQEVKG